MRELSKRDLQIEALGVPEGIVGEADRLFNIVVKAIYQTAPNNYRYSGKENEVVIHIGINQKFKISDLEIPSIQLIFIVDEMDKIDFIQLGNNERIRIIKKLGYRYEYTDKTFMLLLKLGCPIGTNLREIIEYFLSNDRQLKSILSHELMHKYDNYKKGSLDLLSGIRYRMISNQDLSNFMSVSMLFDYLYTVYMIESIVRPAEIASDMESGNISRSGFKKYVGIGSEEDDEENPFQKILNKIMGNFDSSKELNDSIKKIRDARNYTFDEFRNLLANDIFNTLPDNVQKMLQRGNVAKHEFFKGVIEPALENVMIDLHKGMFSDKVLNNILDELKRYNSTNPNPDTLQKIESDAKKLFNAYIKRYSYGLKHDKDDVNETMEYFKRLINNINIDADKSLKKIFRLYALAKDDTSSKLPNVIKKIK